MGSVLYIIALVLTLAWVIGFIGFNAGGIIHLFLVIAAFVILLRTGQGKKAL